jgi:hypothetical protein
MTRRSILCSVLGLAGVKVIPQEEIVFAPVQSKPTAETLALLDQYYAVLMQAYSGPVGPVGAPGLRGPSADGQNETEAEHAQRWADALEWNRRWYAKNGSSTEPAE